MPKQKGCKPRWLCTDCVAGTWVCLHKWPVMTKLGSLYHKDFRGTPRSFVLGLAARVDQSLVEEILTPRVIDSAINTSILIQLQRIVPSGTTRPVAEDFL
jgi:hypothetical protein